MAKQRQPPGRPAPGSVGGVGGGGRGDSLKDTRSNWKPPLLKCGLVENFMVELKTDRALNWNDRRIVEL